MTPAEDQALLSWLVASFADLEQRFATLDRRVRDVEIQIETELPPLDEHPRTTQPG